MVVFEETNDENWTVLMPFSLGALPLKIRSIGQHVDGLKHHLNGYFVIFSGACSLELLPKCALWVPTYKHTHFSFCNKLDNNPKNSEKSVSMMLSVESWTKQPCCEL